MTTPATRDLPARVEDFLSGPVSDLLADFLAEQPITAALHREKTARQYAVRNLDLAAEIGRQLVPLIRQACAGVEGAQDEATALARRLTQVAREASQTIHLGGQ